MNEEAVCITTPATPGPLNISRNFYSKPDLKYIGSKTNFNIGCWTAQWKGKEGHFLSW